MKRSIPFYAPAVGAMLFLGACGSGGDATNGSATEEDKAAAVCACVQEKLGKLQAVLGVEGSENWTVQQWTDAMSMEASPCMQPKATAEEELESAQLEKTCPDYEAYKAQVMEFSNRLSQAKRMEQQEKALDIQEITGGGGARDLLNQLSNKGKQ